MASCIFVNISMISYCQFNKKCHHILSYYSYVWLRALSLLFFCKNIPHYNSLTLMGCWHLAASMIKTRPVTKGWMSSLWANGQHATLSLENLNAKPVPDILVVIGPVKQLTINFRTFPWLWKAQKVVACPSVLW